MWISSCALGRESCGWKSTATKQCLVLLLVCIILHWSWFMRDLKLFKFCFLASFLSTINKSLRGGDHPIGKMLQEELFLQLPKGWQIYFPLLFWDQKNPTVLHWSKPEMFHFIFPPRDGMSTKCPSWPEILTFSIAPGHCTSSLKHTVTYPSFFRNNHPGLSWQKEVQLCLCRVSWIPVTFPCEAVAQVFARILLFCRWTH